MTPAEKFNMWLSIYQMEEYAPEVAACFAETAELLDYMRVPEWVLKELQESDNEH